MGIDLQWEDEKGGRLDEVRDARGYLGLALSLSDLDGTACLRFIDPYGNTVFNQSQIPILIAELESLRPSITEEDIEALFKDQARWFTNLPQKMRNEIEQSRDGLTADAVGDHIELILRLARQSRGDAHTYLRFYGDEGTGKH